MAIKGSLKEASLPDVLQLLALGQKTGCLAIADRTNFGYIFFERGRICYASIVNRRDRLGDILVKNELITTDQLEQAVAAQTQRRDRKLGEILVEQGAISRERLERYMRLQIEEAVYFLFTWTQGTFNFEADVRPERQDFLVSINPESLLLEGARRVDEWSLIEKKIPSLDLIFIVDRDRLAISDATLNEAQRLILPLIDGQRDVHQVIEDSGLSEFEVGKALYGLVTAGFLHRAGRSSIATRVAPVSDARIEEHRNLGVAFYKTGMLEEAAREFRRVVELRPGDAKALWACGMVAIRQARWREAMETLRLAAERGGSRPAVLANLGFAYEQLGRLGDADASYAEAAARGVDDARVHLGWGIVALKQGDVAAAATRLDRARQLAAGTVPAAWYGPGSRRGRFTAERSEEGVRFAERLRNNPPWLELRGDLEAAEHQLTEARRDEPSLPQASKNLGDLAYRRGRYDDAWEHYRRAAQLLPDLGDDVYFKLGNIAFKHSGTDRAAAGAAQPGHAGCPT
jgi:tetratricopeptide (TPR) repeat protein